MSPETRKNFPRDKLTVQENTLSAKLGYTPVKDFKWIAQIQQIVDCPVTVHNIDIAYVIWDKKNSALKGRTTGKKTIHVAGDIVKITIELIKLQKDVFIFLSCNITFTTVRYLDDINPLQSINILGKYTCTI